MNQALPQVSAISRVNGLVPTTRTACSFGLDSEGARGTIWDPLADVPAFDLEIDIPAMVRRYYSAFPLEAPLAEMGEGFVGVELTSGVRFSVDGAILRQAREVESNEAAFAFIEMLQRRRFELRSLNGPTVAVGPDGFRLEAPVPPTEPE